MTLPLVAIVALAFATEAAVGFGGTLIALSLGSLVTSIDVMLPALVPVNMVLSSAIVLRAPKGVSVRMLAGKVLPAMIVGFPVGLVAFERLPRTALQLAFAAFVFVLAALELARMGRRAGADRAPSPRLSTALLVAGGVAHGAFATGGPPVVYVCARTLPDKTGFRATMSALWLVSNAILVTAYAVAGRITLGTLRDSALLVPGLAAGLVVGDLLHGRIPERSFRAFVFALLLVVAVVLAARA